MRVILYHRRRRKGIDMKDASVLAVVIIVSSLLFFGGGCYGDDTTTTTTKRKNRNRSIPERKDLTKNDECALYLAPSSIPGAGLGMYAGSKPYTKGERIGDPDLMLPVYDLDWHNGFQDFSFLWDEYTWSSSTSFCIISNVLQSSSDDDFSRLIFLNSFVETNNKNRHVPWNGR
jgi:hypothetical protein